MKTETTEIALFAEVTMKKIMSEKQVFYIAVESGPLEVNVELTGDQMEAILLDTPEPLLTETIIETLCRNETLAKKVQQFLNTTDEAGHIAVVTKYVWLKNRSVYEVPLQRLPDGSIRPAMVIGYDAIFFYTPDLSRVCVAAREDLALVLEKQETARYLGVAGYSAGGIGHYEWEPDSE